MDGFHGALPLPGFALLRQADLTSAPTLRWPSRFAGLQEPPRLRTLDGVPFFARLVPDSVLRSLAADHGWVPAAQVLDATGQIGAVWREPDGGLVLPFDPNEAIQNLTMERYRGSGGGERATRSSGFALRAYYLVRPLLPRRVQLIMRRAFSRIQARRAFPNWPFEPARHNLARRFYEFVTEITDAPPPWIAPWPKPYSWALVLTHDVETAVGYDNMLEICAEEEARGYRSAWNFVPRRYTVDDARVQELTDAGFEVGIHGLYHDGRDLESRQTIRDRLPAIRQFAERWSAVGFRSPATQRQWEWMGLLGFDYDSSYPGYGPI